MIIPTQIRAARALIGWTQADLARASGLAEVSIKKIEGGGTDPRVGSLRAIETALTEAGVVFIPENGGGVGVRLFKEPLVGWKQVSVAFASGEPIRTAFDQAFFAGPIDPDIALFSRATRDMKTEVFLVPPKAARQTDRLPGHWQPAVNPSLFAWSLEMGPSDAWERFRLPANRN